MPASATLSAVSLSLSEVAQSHHIVGYLAWLHPIPLAQAGANLLQPIR
jgi:hypothetical protein